MTPLLSKDNACGGRAPTPRPWRLGVRLLGGVAAALWCGAVFAGMAAMQRFDFAPGDDGGAPKVWPSSSALPHTAGVPTLVVLAHPRCPCTEATIQELAEVVARTRSGTAVFVSFYTPAGAGEEWTGTAVWRRAAAIPGVVIVKDESGQEAKLFHASTSGRTLLYGEQGELLFEGGITAARGHPGENAGESSLIALLSHQAATTATTPVFGCQITAQCRK